MKSNPKTRGVPVAIIGEKPIDSPQGGLLYRRPGDYYSLVYFWRDPNGPFYAHDEDLINIYEFEVEPDPEYDLDFVNWSDLARFMRLSPEELSRRAHSSDARDRAFVYESAGRYYGFDRLDPDPEILPIRGARHLFSQPINRLSASGAVDASSPKLKAKLLR